MTAGDWMTAVAAAVSALSTVAIAIFSYQSKRVSERMAEINDQLAWFTGAMESHSMLQTRMMAEDKGIKQTWWDPSVEPWPWSGEHGKSVQPLKQAGIRLGVPRPHRRGKQTR